MHFDLLKIFLGDAFKVTLDPLQKIGIFKIAQNRQKHVKIAFFEILPKNLVKNFFRKIIGKKVFLKICRHAISVPKGHTQYR